MCTSFFISKKFPLRNIREIDFLNLLKRDPKYFCTTFYFARILFTPPPLQIICWPIIYFDFEYTAKNDGKHSIYTYLSPSKDCRKQIFFTLEKHFKNINATKTGIVLFGRSYSMECADSLERITRYCVIFVCAGYFGWVLSHVLAILDVVQRCKSLVNGYGFCERRCIER